QHHCTTIHYILSLHNALPIYHISGAIDSFDRMQDEPTRTVATGVGWWKRSERRCNPSDKPFPRRSPPHRRSRYECRSAAKSGEGDRKSTRLNSSHVSISYAVF